jgi:phage tail sheath protein FI
MSVTISYPGVYVEEIPTGPRPIQGVGTSTAAFIGWSARGPIDRAQRVRSFSEFVRHFCGMDRRSLLGYSVQQFFANGGRDAYVVRLAADNALSASATLSRTLKVRARSPGRWAEEYSIEIGAQSDDPSRFRLTGLHTPPGQPAVAVESFEDLSMLPEDSRSVTRVLDAESALVEGELVRPSTSPPASTPAGAPVRLAGGDDGDVLAPNTAAFEAKLSPDGGGGGLGLLDRIDFDLICVPGETNAAAVATLQKYCGYKRAFAIVDSGENASVSTLQGGPDPAMTGEDAANSALYFPWVKSPDPLEENRLRDFPPSGFVAGLYARTDGTRGVWKAPAGREAVLIGATGVALALTDEQNPMLSARGINCIRTLPEYGTVAWGSRTQQGADQLASEWKYVPVRRLALFIEKSVRHGIRWAVFEPNGEPLWATIRVNVGAFLHGLFRQGAFTGNSPPDAYFVKCDGQTTTQGDVDRGFLNVVVGFAPVKPAEFVVIRIEQIACQRSGGSP